MILFSVAVAGIIFWEVFRRLASVSDARNLVELSLSGFALIRSSNKSDDEKARESRQLSVKLLFGLVRLLCKLAVAILASAMLLYGVAVALDRSFDELVAETATIAGVLLATVAVVVYEKIRRVLQGN